MQNETFVSLWFRSKILLFKRSVSLFITTALLTNVHLVPNVCERNFQLPFCSQFVLSAHSITQAPAQAPGGYIRHRVGGWPVWIYGWHLFVLHLLNCPCSLWLLAIHPCRSLHQGSGCSSEASVHDPCPLTRHVCRDDTQTPSAFRAQAYHHILFLPYPTPITSRAHL